ncbi:VTT domain-containing protein [Arthrobacter sp. H35-D1]|uniref:DedA family protein n=1 Tax=Arthrobacter sp. H35-D1 TaxID=3046202 RepID=UPI0024B90FE6|nr:VTT domain-containing protein [Arthrobacter sp. H35-D1]MDJ0312515.1 VTT domain-containing protein [Arthrobacter sp. H35-D1]
MELAADATGFLSSFWIYVVGAGFVAFSALLPPVPSTTVFVALGALAGIDGGPNAGFLVLAMLAGAVAGDLATYGLMRLFGQTRWGSTRGPRRQRAVDAGTRRLRQRPYMFMLTSRFIPLGRLSANMAATIAGYPLRAFLVFSLVSGSIWSLYSVGIGILTQFWPNVSTQVAVLIAIVASIVLGWLVGKVSTWLLDRKNSREHPAAVLPES